MKFCFTVFLLQFIFIAHSNAQNYHAVEGSSYAGSLGVAHNPASIVNTPFPWDIDLISFQVKSETNAFTVHNFSLLSPSKHATLQATNGYYSRYADIGFNLHLFNGRFSLNRKQAFAFGANVRGYGRMKSGPLSFSDTLQNTTQFFNSNDIAKSYYGNFTSSAWVEGFLTYSQTLWDDSRGRLNAGITVNVMRGISGAFANLQNGTYSYNPNGSNPYYTVRTANARYGYSYNYDGWKDNKSTGQNIRDFLYSNTRGGISFDLGMEYLIKSQGVSNDYEYDDYYEYDWKIGVSLLDIGHNQYRYGNMSHALQSPAINVTDSTLNQKFNAIKNFGDFNDSLATVVNGFTSLNGKFKIMNPTRLAINVDRPLGNDFYLNLDMSLNLSKIFSGNNLYVQDIHLLTITPRWETRRWGAYLPLQYSVEGKLWLGGAFKAGPLLIGIHNWANIFSKNKIQNGGGYIAMVIRPSKMTHKKSDKRMECPGIRP